MTESKSWPMTKEAEPLPPISPSQTQSVYGNTAKNQVARNSTNIVFDTKRLIGRKFSDPIVQKDMNNCPFRVEADDKPLIIVKHRQELRSFTLKKSQ